MKKLIFYVCLLLLLCMTSEVFAQSTKDKSREAKKDKATRMYGYELNSKDDDDGTWCIAPMYEEAAKYFSESIAGVQLNGRVGYIDIHNRFVIEPQFDADDDLLGFSQGLSAVKKGGKYGYINKAGEFVIEPQFDKAENFDEKLVAVVKKGSKVGLIDLLGEEILPCKYLTAEVMKVASFGKTYKNAVNTVKSNKDNGKYDELIARIEEVNKPIEVNIRNEQYIPDYPSDIVPYQESGKWGLKNGLDSCMLQPVYDEIYAIESPFFVLKKDNKWGACDSYGRIVVLTCYDFIDYEATSGVFQVRENDYIGAYVNNGLPIVLPSFDYVGTFDNTGVAQVWSGSTEGTVDMEGNVSKGLSDLLLGEAHLVASEGDDVKARQLYERVVKLNKKCGMAYICLGVLEVDAQMVEEGIAHIKKGGKVSKELSKIASHNAKEAKKPMGQRNWMDGRSTLAYLKSKESGQAQVDTGVVDSKFSEELSAQAQAAASSLSQNSESQKNAKACCEVLKARYKELQEKMGNLSSEQLKEAFKSELDRLERLVVSKGGVID